MTRKDPEAGAAPSPTAAAPSPTAAAPSPTGAAQSPTGAAPSPTAAAPSPAVATTPGVTGTQSPVPMSGELTAQPTPTPMPRWNLGDMLGRGGYAEVFLITNSSKRAVLKVARHTGCSERYRQLNSMLLAERKFLEKAGDHPNVIKLVTLDERNEEALVTEVDEKASGGSDEKASGGSDEKISLTGLALSFCDLDLFALLMSSAAMPVGRGEGYSLQTVFKLAEDMLSGLAHIHAAGILHRDIKPENILLKVNDGEIRAIIADFGIAVDSVNAAKNTKHIVGTFEWSNPDRCRRKSNNKSHLKYGQADKVRQIDTEYDDVWAVMNVIRLLVQPNKEMRCFIDTEESGEKRIALLIEKAASFAKNIVPALHHNRDSRSKSDTNYSERILAKHLHEVHKLISPWMFEVDGPCHEIQKNSFKMLLLTMLLSIDGLPKFDVDGKALAERWKSFGKLRKRRFKGLVGSLSDFFRLKSRSPEEDSERDPTVAKKALRMFECLEEQVSDKGSESRPVETAGPGQAAPSV